MNTEYKELTQMLEDFVSGRDRSVRHVWQIEDLLIGSFYDTALYDDILGVPVASYDEEALARVFRDALHALATGAD